MSNERSHLIPKISRSQSDDLIGKGLKEKNGIFFLETIGTSSPNLNLNPFQSKFNLNETRITINKPDNDKLDQNGTFLTIAIYGSLVVNIILFVSKGYAAIVSNSLSIAAACLDSALDLFSQLIIFVAEMGMKNFDRNTYPAGRARLEQISIILCACVMGMASIPLILSSSSVLIEGFLKGEEAKGSNVEFDFYSLTALAATVLSKFILWIICRRIDNSPTAMALAVDHRNDVLANLLATFSALATEKMPSAWFLDPIAAILMSVYIIINWVFIGYEQVDHLVGKAASEEFIQELRVISSAHSKLMVPDIIRAYHFGSRFIVEVEIIVDKNMTVERSHDLCLSLQQKIEALDEVERAFVHIDYKSRSGIDEHSSPKV